MVYFTAKVLLERMNALETYPPQNPREAADLAASLEYAHVKNFSRGRSCGTLSKYEWEASCKLITVVHSINAMALKSIHFILFFSALSRFCVSKDEKTVQCQRRSGIRLIILLKFILILKEITKYPENSTEFFL